MSVRVIILITSDKCLLQKYHCQPNILSADFTSSKSKKKFVTLWQIRKAKMTEEHFDCLIIGAGISGINAAYHLQK